MRQTHIGKFADHTVRFQFASELAHLSICHIGHIIARPVITELYLGADVNTEDVPLAPPAGAQARGEFIRIFGLVAAIRRERLFEYIINSMSELTHNFNATSKSSI